MLSVKPLVKPVIAIIIFLTLPSVAVAKIVLGVTEVY